MNTILNILGAVGGQGGAPQPSHGPVHGNLQQSFPSIARERKRYWEGFFGPGWFDISKNSTVSRLALLRGDSESVRQLRNAYIKARDSRNIVLSLLAGVGAAAVSIPGIETAHWLTRSLFMGSAALAIAGVMTGACAEGIFTLFFGEDLDSPGENHQYLTLHANPRVALQADRLMTLGGVPLSGAFFLAGIIVFACTADFGQVVRGRPPRRWLFALVTIGPTGTYLTYFWWVWMVSSIAHRHFRNSARRSANSGS